MDTATTGTAPAGEPAVLAGFGEISDRLLAQLDCDCAITTVIVDPTNPHHVLDVGRTQRLATLKQRQAIVVQQGGVCFNPSCDLTRVYLQALAHGGKAHALKVTQDYRRARHHTAIRT